MCSCTSIPFTRKPLDDSRWPLMDRLPGFRSPEGSRLPVTPAMMTELGNKVEIGATPGWIARRSVIAPSIQRERGDLRTRYDLAEVSCGGLDLHAASLVTVHTVRLRADRECCIHA